jgi:hypothetical protein
MPQTARPLWSEDIVFPADLRIPTPMGKADRLRRGGGVGHFQAFELNFLIYAYSYRHTYTGFPFCKAAYTGYNASCLVGGHRHCVHCSGGLPVLVLEGSKLKTALNTL